MTTEHLLDAIGLLDDDLIQEAEVYPVLAASPWRRMRRWSSLAACLVLVAAVGYLFTLFGMKGNSSSSGTAAEWSMDSATGNQSAPTSDSDSSGLPMTAARGLIYVETGTGTSIYSLSGDIADALPGDSRSLGVLSQLYSDGPAPATDAEEYVGCELWAEGEDTVPATVYIQLPEGGYAAAELVQP